MEYRKQDADRVSSKRADGYIRYHIETAETEDRQKIPRRFNVEVGKLGLAKLILSEMWKYRGKLDVIMSRPCTYGVFSGPVGGFSPRPEHCVGCLRCTVQHPEFVTVTHNPDHRAMGDSYFTHGHVWTIDEEARKGNVPVRGQGYRGRFGGPGFDMMLTDMSEIVRPSRDGIHGRELIGTSVDLGTKPMFLSFDEQGLVVDGGAQMITLQLPIIFDLPPRSVRTPLLARVWARAAAETDGLALLPADLVRAESLDHPNVGVVLSVETGGAALSEQVAAYPKTRIFEIDRWDAECWQQLDALVGDRMVAVRQDYGEGWLESVHEMVNAGVPVIHLVADGHGRSPDGRFIMELLETAHMSLVNAGIRERVSLVGSGGIVAADHVPKAIICGLDAVAIDTAALVALQGRPTGELRDLEAMEFVMPARLDEAWGGQRLKNLCGAWRDQLLEILGAMGIREVRRLRGEFGRSMRVDALEAEAFGDIEGFTERGA